MCTNEATNRLTRTANTNSRTFRINLERSFSEVCFIELGLSGWYEGSDSPETLVGTVFGKTFLKRRNKSQVSSSKPSVAGTNIIAVCNHKLIWTIFRAIKFTMLLTPIGALVAVAIKAPDSKYGIF